MCVYVYDFSLHVVCVEISGEITPSSLKYRRVLYNDNDYQIRLDLNEPNLAEKEIIQIHIANGKRRK